MEPDFSASQHTVNSIVNKQISDVDTIYEAIRSFEEVALSVIDDACYERTEAVLSILITNFHIDNSRLGRAFIMNTVPGQYLSQTKPLATGNNPLTNWFEKRRAAGELFPGATFIQDQQTFKVNEFQSLVCDSMPQIYFDERSEAYWGIGHAAPVMDGMILDPSLGKGPLLLSEWSQSFNCPGLIPLLGDVDRQPELATTFFTEDVKERIANIMQDRSELFGVSNTRELFEYLHIIPRLPYNTQHAFYNALFHEQIELGAIVPHEYWSPLFPGPLTFRGQVYGSPSATKKLIIHADLASTWQERKERALNILEPFRAFHSLIVSG